MKLVEGQRYIRRDGTITPPLQAVGGTKELKLLEDTATNFLFCGCGRAACLQALQEPSGFDLIEEALDA